MYEEIEGRGGRGGRCVGEEGEPYGGRWAEEGGSLVGGGRDVAGAGLLDDRERVHPADEAVRGRRKREEVLRRNVVCDHSLASTLAVGPWCSTVVPV